MQEYRRIMLHAIWKTLASPWICALLNLLGSIAIQEFEVLAVRSRILVLASNGTQEAPAANSTLVFANSTVGNQTGKIENPGTPLETVKKSAESTLELISSGNNWYFFGVCVGFALSFLYSKMYMQREKRRMGTVMASVVIFQACYLMGVADFAALVVPVYSLLRFLVGCSVSIVAFGVNVMMEDIYADHPRKETKVIKAGTLQALSGGLGVLLAMAVNLEEKFGLPLTLTQKGVALAIFVLLAWRFLIKLNKQAKGRPPKIVVAEEAYPIKPMSAVNREAQDIIVHKSDMQQVPESEEEAQPAVSQHTETEPIIEHAETETVIQQAEVQPGAPDILAETAPGVAQTQKPRWLLSVRNGLLPVLILLVGWPIVFFGTGVNIMLYNRIVLFQNENSPLYCVFLAAPFVGSLLCFAFRRSFNTWELLLMGTVMCSALNLAIFLIRQGLLAFLGLSADSARYAIVAFMLFFNATLANATGMLPILLGGTVNTEAFYACYGMSLHLMNFVYIFAFTRLFSMIENYLFLAHAFLALLGVPILAYIISQRGKKVESRAPKAKETDI